MKPKSIVSLLLAGASCLAIATTGVPAHAQASNEIKLDIPAQDLSDALSEFSKTNNLDLIFDADELKAERSTAISGSYEPMEALGLMLSDSGLTYRRGDSGAIIVDRPAEATPAKATPAPPAATTEQDTPQTPEATDEPDQEADAVFRQNTVTVTARKKDESDLDVPIAIQAYGQEEIERRGIQDLSDLAAVTPSLNISPTTGSSGATMTLRGIGTSSVVAGTDQAVALNLDGMTVSDGTAVRFAQFDIAQIEVLQGPQSLYFGKNTSAGIISVISADPTDEFYSKLRAGYTFESEAFLTEAVVSGPLMEGVSGRLALYRNDMEGYFDNPLASTNVQPPQDLVDLYGPIDPDLFYDSAPNSRDFGGRATLKFEPSNSLTVRLKASYLEQKGSGTFAAAQYFYCPNGEPIAAGSIPGVGECELDHNVLPAGQAATSEVAGDPYFGNGKAYQKLEQMLYVGDIDYDITDNISLKSVTGYYEYSHRDVGNVTFSPYPAASTGQQMDREEFSQEFRLSTDFNSPLNGTVGAYFQSGDYSVETPVTIFQAPAPASFYYIDSELSSVFADLTYEMLDGALSISAGGRYTDQEKSVKLFSQALDAFVTDLPVDEIGSSRFTPEVTVSWQPTPNINLFATYKKGSKAGGFSTGALEAPPYDDNDLSYGDETAEGIEGGIKSVLFDGALRLDLTAYDYDYKDLQVQIYDPVLATPSTRNAASAQIRGVQFSTNYQPPEIPGFRISAGLNYSDARFEDYLATCYAGQTISEGCNRDALGNIVETGGVAQSLAGRPPNNAPDWSGSITANYEFPVTADQTMVGLSAGANYSSEYYAITTQPPQSLQDEYTTLDAQIRLFNEERGWELALIGKNLTDELRVQWGVETPFTPGVPAMTGTPGPGVQADLAGTTNAPRTVMVRLTVEPSTFFGGGR